MDTNYIGLCGALLSWALLAYYLYNKTDDNIKVTRNYISTIHATFVLLFFTFSVPAKWLFFVTVGYYTFDGIVDLYYLIKTKRFYNLTIVSHHIISCFILSYLNDEVVAKYLYYSFFLIEISNFPIYIVYHLKSNKYDNETVIKSLIVVEALSFLILRLVLCGINVYRTIISGEVPYPPILGGIAIYCMSVIWFYGMILQIFKSKKQKAE